MKKILLAISFIASSVINVYSQQITNGNLESWQTSGSNVMPSSFYTFDHVMGFALDTTTVKTTDAHSGQFAALLQNVQAGSVLQGQLTYGSFQKIGFTNYFYGHPFTSRPDNMKFWYKFIPAGNDTAIASIVMSKANNIISFNILKIYNSTLVYTEATVPVSYSSSLMPDTIYVSFMSSGWNDNPHAGTKFYVDDISLDYSGVGISELSLKNSVAAYPNPFSDKLTFDETGNYEINIVDQTGKEVFHALINGKTSINTGFLDSGIYTVRYKNEKRTEVLKMVKL